MVRIPTPIPSLPFPPPLPSPFPSLALPSLTNQNARNRSLTPNTRISAFDPLCEVQSDKASVEITSPFDGVVVELLVQEGEIAKVGSGLCVIEVDAEAGADSVETSANTTSLDVKVGEEARAASAPFASASAPAPASGNNATKRKHPLDPSNPPKKLDDLRLGTPKGKTLFGKNLDSFSDEGVLSSPGGGTFLFSLSSLPLYPL